TIHDGQSRQQPHSVFGKDWSNLPPGSIVRAFRFQKSQRRFRQSTLWIKLKALAIQFPRFFFVSRQGQIRRPIGQHHFTVVHPGIVEHCERSIPIIPTMFGKKPIALFKHLRRIGISLFSHELQRSTLDPTIPSWGEPQNQIDQQPCRETGQSSQVGSQSLQENKKRQHDRHPPPGYRVSNKRF
ncbi:hypothetical protein, partial [Rhodopirellula bahusiensis]|uniref:hypothetical protein n=1 Tax=Rhodopirellula bahusiensis TaxID=2014065 RepID=UPI00329860BD